jgi:hypothetical protein
VLAVAPKDAAKPISEEFVGAIFGYLATLAVYATALVLKKLCSGLSVARLMSSREAFFSGDSTGTAPVVCLSTSVQLGVGILAEPATRTRVTVSVRLK